MPAPSGCGGTGGVDRVTSSEGPRICARFARAGRERSLGPESVVRVFEGGCVQEMMEQLTALTTQCAEVPMWSLTEAELLETLDCVHAAQQVLQAALLHAVREVEGRDIPARQQAATVNMWLRARLRISPAQAGRLLTQSRVLDAEPELDAAVVAGKVNTEQLTAVCQSLGELPRRLDSGVRKQAVGTLLDWVGQLDPVDLRRAGLRILDHVHPDRGDKAEENRLRLAEREAREQRFVTLTPVGDGRVRLRGILDSEAAAVVAAAMDPLCNPRRPAPREAVCQAGSQAVLETGAQAGAQVGHPADGVTGDITAEDGTGGGSSAGESWTGESWAGGSRADTRTPGQRRADALVEVCRLVLAGGRLPTNGGDRPQVSVTVSYDTLRDGLGAGVLDTGEPVSAETARRLACDAQILPFVLDGAGQVLDAGRSRRLVDGPLRRALIARDRGCTFPECDRPARWCEGHHIVSWADGGPTDLTNLALMCAFHHHVIHGDSGWEVRPGADGHPEFLPPARLDPDRQPRRNRYHRRT